MNCSAASCRAGAVALLVAPLDGNGPSFSLQCRHAHESGLHHEARDQLSLLSNCWARPTCTAPWHVSAAPLDNGVLIGDLVIRGSGDPHLSEQDLWALLRQLRGRGIREISGNVADRPQPVHTAAG